MAKLIHYPCITKVDFDEYKDWMDGISTKQGYKNYHTQSPDSGIFPALVVSYIHLTDKERVCTHTIISKKTLLKVLGLTQEEIKIEFDLNLEPILADTLEQREI